MKAARIRAMALCAVRNGNRFLFQEGFDSATKETFARPAGGGIEFGEPAEEAVRREFREELDAELSNLRLLGVAESIFHFEGRPGHQIIFLFVAHFEDETLNKREEFEIQEKRSRGRATWMSLEDLSRLKRPLYPSGLRELLSAELG